MSKSSKLKRYIVTPLEMRFKDYKTQHNKALVKIKREPLSVTGLSSWYLALAFILSPLVPCCDGLDNILNLCGSVPSHGRWV